jgi:predicted O-methyltransferase YrrM
MMRRWALQVPPIRRLVNNRDALGLEIRRLQTQLSSLEQRERQSEDQAIALTSELAKAGVYPLGTYHSPVPDMESLRPRIDELLSDREIPGIDFRDDKQLELAQALGKLAVDAPFGSSPEEAAVRGHRYFYDNGFYFWGDGVVLHTMLRHIRPMRVIEIGSGFSSANMLDTAEQFLGDETLLTFIEPYPERLYELLRPGDRDADRVCIIERKVEDVDVAIFDDLVAGDILFIDSSHVSRIGGEVNYLLLDIVPRLVPGVYVHVHDVYWPFEYPRHWIEEGRWWNEAYLLRGLLTDNDRIQIEFFSDYLSVRHHSAVAAALPVWAQNAGAGIWLRTL